MIIQWLVAALIGFNFFTPVLAKLDNSQVDLVQYARDRAEAVGIDSERFVRIMACESHLQKKAAGDYRSETGENMANGILQFWRGTFDKFSLKYNMHGEYLNPYDQIDLAVQMIAREKNGWYHWTNCYKYTAK